MVPFRLRSVRYVHRYITATVRALPYLTGDGGLLLFAGGLHSLLGDEGLQNTRVSVLRIPEH